jgi:phosphoribosylformylglycinamidine (FGAM) synthase-like amidotransferase family enzyme
MAEVRALVLRAAGVNCDMETRHALELAGAGADRIHVNRLIEDKGLLDRYHIVVFPGGFSYGDDVAAGRILANQIVHHLSDPIRRFIDDGKLVLGICNGFQVLVKMGVLPGNGAFKQEQVTITYNDSGKYEDRWVHLLPQTDRCVFIEPERQVYLPVAHGEGKVVTADVATLERLKSEGYIAYKYVGPDGEEGPYPINPNGSVAMPHPERFVRRTQHPHWTRLGEDLDPDGIKIFRNAVRYAQENLLQSCSA